MDFIGHYEDVNYEGDGLYTQWHYHFFHGKLLHHLGTAQEAPYRVTWDTSWVPDQKQPMAIAARIVGGNGMIYMTEAVTDLSLDRAGLHVELCKPYDIPKKWATRSGEKQEHFVVTGDLSKAVAAQLVWSSWSPGYMRGVSINGTQVFDTEGPKYAVLLPSGDREQSERAQAGRQHPDHGQDAADRRANGPRHGGELARHYGPDPVHRQEVRNHEIEDCRWRRGASSCRQFQLSLAAEIPFKYAAIDDSVKDPWAKIVADIDRDGFPDIVIGGQAGPLVWYRYPDWTKAVIAKGGYRTVDGEAGDIDGDGDLDIVMGGLIWYENPLPKGDPAKTRVDRSHGGRPQDARHRVGRFG